MIKLGAKVKDRVSGFTGIATSRIEYLYGCVRIGITGKISKDGKFEDATHFDEDGVEEIGLGVNKPKKKPTGGSFENPHRMNPIR